MLRLPQASDYTARALPPNPFSASDLPQLYAAFDLCLYLEARAHLVPLPDPNHPSVVVCARVLGFTLTEASDEGRDHMAQAIGSGSTDNTLLALGKYYIQHLLRVFKSHKGRTPAPSEHPSRPDLDDVQEFCKFILEQASLNHSTAKAAALVRDGFHCMIKTNLYDAQYFERNRSTIIAQDPEWDVGTLRWAHIFPEGLNSDLGGIEVPSDKREWVASVWAVMYMFGIHMEELNGTGIHRLENILTLSPSLQDFFDQSALWFEAVENQPNTYTIVSTISSVLERLPSRVVTFTTPNTNVLPLPSPAYLAIHAACCRVAHLSGAAEYVEKVLREEEEIRERMGSMCTLAEDGSSMDLFGQYIDNIAVQGV
ncbi:hypothetical protein IW261DRAFT_1493671 [Armillaria novae-zelandiae]|uniref:HNH nuclease domain-containing protein n=1 Tax=Armillaria novae-zelandiae TaxID=153914 RepID=A0AA39P238_9AGAR|nr:hypothetical protein IW261DRAFT_1493671 [Armillaria novae-zelandiae]